MFRKNVLVVGAETIKWASRQRRSWSGELMNAGEEACGKSVGLNDGEEQCIWQPPVMSTQALLETNAPAPIQCRGFQTMRAAHRKRAQRAYPSITDYASVLA
jgi:hypothetical protein